MAYACLYILSRRGEREGAGRKRRKTEGKQRRDREFRKWGEDAEEMGGNGRKFRRQRGREGVEKRGEIRSGRKQMRELKGKTAEG